MANYFSLLLVVLTLGSGLIWLIDALAFAPKRKARGVALSGNGERAGNDERAGNGSVGQT